MNLNLVSFFAKYYLDLCDRIRTEVPEIKLIEQDFGQDALDKWRSNVMFPTILIDFPTVSYNTETTMSQLAEVTLNIRLLSAPFKQSNDNAPIEIKEDALLYFDIEQKLTKALNGWQPDGEYCQPLIRSSIQSNNRNDIGLRIRNLTFTTAYEENYK